MKKLLIIRRVHGHSMVPVLPPGHLVVGFGWDRNFKVGDILIFEHDGKEKIKRLEKIEEDGTLFVVGEHPETSTDSRHFGAIEPSTVLARVIWPHPNPQ